VNDQPDNSSLYRDQWDRHVETWAGAEGLDWPGDEWGTPELWEQLFEKMFVPFGVADWASAVEIGGGSGKYTEKVLSRSDPVHVIDFDVSGKFLDVCRRRLASYVDSGRLELVPIPSKRSSEVFLEIERRGLVRQLDGFYSIDSMVHVDLQYLIAYLITAALTLRPGGHLILTLADATSERGFAYLVARMASLYPRQGEPTAKFEFLSPEIVRFVLGRLGFEITFFEHLFPGRDIHVVAKLENVAVADSFRQALA
jgi:hypothetical protein